jgi:hypothetical protein
MKLLRRALDWRDPRSLWHRPICVGALECAAPFLIYIGGTVTVLLFVTLAAHLLLDVAGPVVCRVAIALGLDDADMTLHHMAVAVNASVHFIDPHWSRAANTIIALEQAIVGVLVFVGTPCYAFYLYRREQRPSKAVLCALATPCLTPFLPLLVAFVAPFVASVIFAGVVGVIADAVDWLTPPARMSLNRASLIETVRHAVPLLAQRSTGFYTRVAAAGMLLGASAGLFFAVLLFLGIPAMGLAQLYRRCKLDVEETLHDLQV